MGKASKRRRAERWLGRTPLNRVKLADGGFGADWDDPKIVKDEINRIDEHIRERQLRMSGFSKEIERLEGVLRDAPSQLDKYRKLLSSDTTQVEQLRERKITAQFRLSGAEMKTKIAQLKAKIAEREIDLAATERGERTATEERAARVKAAKSGQYASGLGEPEVGASHAPTKAEIAQRGPRDSGKAAIDPQVAADALRRKIGTRS